MVQIAPGLKWEAELDRTAPRRRGQPLRFKVRKPRVPWRYPPRSTTPREYTECGGPRIYRDKYLDLQGYLRAVRKACGPRKTAREFDVTGAEGGTLVGARRAAGLFDDNWDRQFPLTRKERELLEQREPVLDPFFAPPTTPDPGNWIDDKIRRIRGTFGPTIYQTPKAYSRFCPEGGTGITCAGPDGEVGWTGGSRALTPLEVARFKEAYCQPGQCQHGGTLTPPPGFKEFVVKVRPRNPGTALKASCQPVLAAAPVVTDVPLAPAVAPAPPPPSYECAPGSPNCVLVNCTFGGQEQNGWFLSTTPPEVIRAWLVQHCGWPP